MQPLTHETVFSFFLIFTRFAAIMTFIPALGDVKIPMKTKLLLSVFISFTAMNIVSDDMPKPTSSNSLTAYYLTSEMLIGSMFGLTAKIIFTSLLVVGNLVSMQSGLSAATIFDPNQKDQIMIFSSFIVSMTVVMIFISDAHHIFIAGFIETYKVFKPGLMPSIADMADNMSQVITESFLLAFKISSPFLIIGVAILFASGILSRLMPSLQVLFVITPGQILVMFGVLYLVLNHIISLVIDKMTMTFSMML